MTEVLPSCIPLEKSLIVSFPGVTPLSDRVKQWHLGILSSFDRRYEDDQEEAIEEAYQDYLFRQGQRAKIAELKNTKEAKPGDLLGKASAEVREEREEAYLNQRSLC